MEATSLVENKEKLLAFLINNSEDIFKKIYELKKNNIGSILSEFYISRGFWEDYRNFEKVLLFIKSSREKDLLEKLENNLLPNYVKELIEYFELFKEGCKKYPNVEKLILFECKVNVDKGFENLINFLTENPKFQKFLPETKLIQCYFFSKKTFILKNWFGFYYKEELQEDVARYMMRIFDYYFSSLDNIFFLYAKIFKIPTVEHTIKIIEKDFIPKNYDILPKREQILYSECLNSMKSGLSNSTVLLSGVIIESLLKKIHKEVERQEFKSNFEDLIKWMKNKLGVKTDPFADGLRKINNYAKHDVDFLAGVDEAKLSLLTLKYVVENLKSYLDELE
ncbi:hypothetical protein HYW99_01380 [Candidatus Woesearchaeota archaeon]|nr:hypothetical protein [Candidatus Aenigmarchaeota archaeon]MBI2647103.1 hypothetical protein [Candidatus Woesearchaeota archaeon]